MATAFQRLSNSFSLLYSKSRIGVKYSRFAVTKNNWGDALNAYLIPRVSGKEIVHYSEYYNLGLTPTLCGIGSILDKNRIKNLYVWGSGLKSPLSPIPVLPGKVFAVRGHLTQQRLKQLNVPCPDVFGDPALALPLYYKPAAAKKKFKLGIVPHYIDKNLETLKSFRGDPEVTEIDIESGIEEFVDRISECEVIASSSLHGLIAADAYGIPRVWLRLSDKIRGGDYKFEDYFSTTDVRTIESLTPANGTGTKEIVARAIRPQRLADINKLIEAFPFR